MSKNTKIILGIGIVVVVLGSAFLINYIRKQRVGATSAMFKSEGSDKSNLASVRGTAAYNAPVATDISERSKIVPPFAPLSDVDAQQNIERLIIKTGALSVVVKDVPASIKSIIALAEKSGGFVVESNTYKSGNAPYGVVTIRIPSKIFDEGVGDIKALGEVVSENIQGTDVTEEYVDLDSQLKNLRAAEEQFLAIMKQATKISDILAVQNELTNVRARIEGIEGRMKYLKQSSEMSSLTINLSTDPSVLPVVENENGEKWRPIVVIKDALRSLVELGKELVNGLIWIVIFAPAWGVALLIIWFIYRKVRKASKKTK